MISINPYLIYKGNCEEAFIFYKTVFGVESLYIGRYKDVPEEAKKFFPNANDEHVMHATLQIDERTVIMGNDSADTSQQSAISFSSDFYLYLNSDNPKEAIRIFNVFSVGGKIILLNRLNEYIWMRYAKKGQFKRHCDPGWRINRLGILCPE